MPQHHLVATATACGLVAIASTSCDTLSHSNPLARSHTGDVKGELYCAEETSSSQPFELPDAPGRGGSMPGNGWQDDVGDDVDSERHRQLRGQRSGGIPGG